MTTSHRRSRPVTGTLVILALLASLATSYLTPSADAAGAVTRAAAPQPATDARTSRTAGLTKLVVVDHNIERRSSALNAALRRAYYAGADILTLQEICSWQVRDLRANHPSWSIVYQRDVDTGACREEGSLPGSRLDSGNAVIWTGGPRAERHVHIFRSQAKRSFQHGLACLRWRSRVVVDVCSVHLVHAGDDKGRNKVLVRQAKQVGQITSPWIEARHLVVLGGDFNSGPVTRPLDFLYKARHGRGRFLEATRCDLGDVLCRATRGVTLDKGRTKIDYLFFSVNRTSASAPHGLVLDRTPSDHHMLTGWAWVDLRRARGGGKRSAA